MRCPEKAWGPVRRFSQLRQMLKHHKHTSLCLSHILSLDSIFHIHGSVFINLLMVPRFMHPDQTSDLLTHTLNCLFNIFTCLSQRVHKFNMSKPHNKSCQIYLLDILWIHPLFSFSTATALVHSTIFSSLNSCKVILFGLSMSTLPLSSVYYIAAREIFYTILSTLPPLCAQLPSLQGLTIVVLIETKIMNITLKGFCGLAPIYVSSLTSLYSFPQSLHSSGIDWLIDWLIDFLEGSQDSHNTVVLSTSNILLPFFSLLPLFHLHFSAQATFFSDKSFLSLSCWVRFS